VRQNLSVVLICIFFMTLDVEHLLMHLLGMCTPFKNRLFNSFDHLLIGLFILSVFIFWALYIFWILIPCLMNSWQGFLSHSVGCLLILRIVSFAVQKLFHLVQPHLSSLGVISWAIDILFRKLLPRAVFLE
jgi:hypothetical protein